MHAWFKPLNPPIHDWRDKRVWIVGASSGIGAALAQSLLAAGAHVTISARREPELQAVAASFPKAHVVAFDSADAKAWPEAMQATLSAMGHIDLVVLGAARYDPTHSWSLNLSDVQKSFDLNVVSVYRALACLVPYFLDRQSGGIALIASISAYTGLPRAIVYGSTKAALNNLAETLYFELAPKGLDVYLINPGFVETPMTSGNDFKMPGLMTPQDAAGCIKSGLQKGRFEIRFPRGFAGTLRLISRLPYRLRFWLLHKTTGM
jgi:short-subunit dehydrogenase